MRHIGIDTKSPYRAIQGQPERKASNSKGFTASEQESTIALVSDCLIGSNTHKGIETQGMDSRHQGQRRSNNTGMRLLTGGCVETGGKSRFTRVNVRTPSASPLADRAAQMHPGMARPRIISSSAHP